MLGAVHGVAISFMRLISYARNDVVDDVRQKGSLR